MKKFITKNFLIISVIGFFLLAYLVLGIQKYNRFETGDDLAIFTQPIWHLSRFEAPFTTILKSYIFNIHFQPILLLLAPFYRLWSDPRIVIAIQQIIVVLGAIPVYLYSIRKTKKKFIGLCISFLYLYFIGMQSALSSDFHTTPISATFIGLSIYFLEIKKWKYYWPSLILALFCKEDVSIYMFALGLYAFFVKKERKIGLITSSISVGYYYLIFNFFMPLLNGTMFTTGSIGTRHIGRIIITTLLTSPLEFLKSFIYPLVKVRNILLTSFSFGFLPFFSPLYWLMAPFTYLRHFATDAIKYSLQRHYVSSLTPILAFSTINVIKKIKTNSIKYLFLVIAIIGTFYTNRPDLDPYFPAPPIARVFRRAFYVLPPRNSDYNKIMELIPEDASASVQVPLLAHLCNRDKIYRFPDKYEEADYVALTFTESFYPMTYEGMESLKNKLLNDENYEQLYLSYAGVLLKRVK